MQKITVRVEKTPHPNPDRAIDLLARAILKDIEKLEKDGKEWVKYALLPYEKREKSDRQAAGTR